jgi:hypothetical protein
MNDGQKKKKRLAPGLMPFPFFSPGAITTNSPLTETPRYTDHQGTHVSYTINRPGPPMGYIDSRLKGASEAFVEYTFSGPVELMGAKSATQAGLLTALGTYPALRTGLAIELGMDFAIMGAVLTITDPANKWEGGLDEWGFLGGNQQESLPNTMSADEGTSFHWGLKQGHLKSLFGG